MHRALFFCGEQNPIVTTPTRILLAEDDTAMRNLLSAVLTRSGFVVVECADGQALIRAIESTREGSPAPDIIVSDVQMPGASGLDVIYTSRSLLPNVPVILITAFGDERTHQRARDLGAVAVLNKPFDLTELRRLITDTVARLPSGQDEADESLDN